MFNIISYKILTNVNRRRITMPENNSLEPLNKKHS